MSSTKTGRGRQPQIILPNKPESQWCTARRLFESGKSFKEIGDIIHCKDRTAKICIERNSEPGQKGTHSALDPYKNTIQDLLKSDEMKGLSIRSITQKIQKFLLKNNDLKVGERTVRYFVTERMRADEARPAVRENGEPVKGFKTACVKTEDNDGTED